jgi:hypothetical protein
MSVDDPELAKLAGGVLARESAGVYALIGAVEDSVVVTVGRKMQLTGKVVTTSSGTSAIMAERMAHLLSVCGRAAVYLPAMDALHGDPQWPARPDGVLVMLIEPGSGDRASIDRLALVTACSAEMPMAVDGGITEDIAPLCVTAGVELVVVGRALLVDLPPVRRRTSGHTRHHLTADRSGTDPVNSTGTPIPTTDQEQ